MMMARDHPLLGVGPEHFRTWFPLKQAEFRSRYTSKGFSYAPKEQKAHNDYMQVLAEQGVIGLGMWLWLAAAVIRLGYLAAQRAGEKRGPMAAGILGGCISLIIDALFNFPFRIIPAAMVFWIFCGIIMLLLDMGPPVAVGGRHLPGLGLPVRRAAAAALAVLGIALTARVAILDLWADRAFSMGLFYINSGMYEMAESSFQVSLSKRNHDALGHYWLGLALRRGSTFDWTGHNWDRALRHYRIAKDMGLNDELLFAQMAMLFEEKGNFERAAEMGELSVRIYPDYGDNAANYAYYLSMREKNLSDALSWIEKAVENTPEHPLYLWTYGLVLEKMGRYGESLTQLGKVKSRLWMLPRGQIYEADLERDMARVRVEGRKR